MNHLSDKQLVSALDKLVITESELTVTIVAHIAQVEERKLYLAEGYSSMFQFLQEKYHYSESSAWRRLSAARALRQFPQVRVSLARIFHQAFYYEGRYTAFCETSALFSTSTYFNMSSPEKNAFSLVNYRRDSRTTARLSL